MGTLGLTAIVGGFELLFKGPDLLTDTDGPTFGSVAGSIGMIIPGVLLMAGGVAAGYVAKNAHSVVRPLGHGDSDSQDVEAIPLTTISPDNAV